MIIRQAPEELRAAVRSAMLEMRRSPSGQRLPAAERMARFITVDDRFYDAIRQMDQEALGVGAHGAPVLAPPLHRPGLRLAVLLRRRQGS